METENKTTNNLNLENINQYNNVFMISNIIKCQQEYQYMIKHFRLYPKNKSKSKNNDAKNKPDIISNNFVHSHILMIKQQIISFYEQKENKNFKYWVIFILSFLLTLPLILFEFSWLLDIIFSL